MEKDGGKFVVAVFMALQGWEECVEGDLLLFDGFDCEMRP
ncbi:hypothetical protein T10_10789 [Trichinella papuae]|uniref:Uncharacterized protein n=1 Tax=Trichinella papuae TaxID=268474 RepID=A0A0V1MW30_9BILA|nr:hypothetical protein T10_10789 [Trichinella papuae]